MKMLDKHDVTISKIVEVGCGLGHILAHLKKGMNKEKLAFEGFDISDVAIRMGRESVPKDIGLYNEDFLLTDRTEFDLLLMIDVFEHVEDYIGFIEKCKNRATYKIYHIPLDLHVSALLRGKLMHAV
jgi:2-polyprenyl-3-methyl-5-hydroxy-6-metoxy-1,4-benzoquinol methylase